MQTFQCSEKLGLYGKNTVGNTDYYIGAGDSGHITVGGTIGGMVIAGGLPCHPYILLLCCFDANLAHADVMSHGAAMCALWSHSLSQALGKCVQV